MYFNSFVFVGAFLLLLLIYWNCPSKYSKYILIFSNILFASSFGIRCLIYALMISLISYLGAKGIVKSEIVSKKKIRLGATIIIMVVLLGFVKYNSLFSDNLNLVIPIGMSFYIFRCISYLVDLYKKKITVSSFADHICYILFFPSFSSGPIDRYGDLHPQLIRRQAFDYEKASKGLWLFIWGLFKKIIVSGHLNFYTSWIYGSVERYKGFTLLFVSLLYTMQIYCDFSGYSDMAIGAAKLLGIDLNENFKSPYISGSVGEFWKRWHVSLSTWLRDYVYIPLGGNRKGKIRQNVNLIITFLVSGMWHGATLNFIIWGLAHGIVQVIEKRAAKRETDNNLIEIVKWVFTFGFINFSWVIFRLPTLREIVYFFTHFLNGINNPIQYVMETQQLLHIDAMTFIRLVIIIGAIFIYDYFDNKNAISERIIKKSGTFRIISMGLLLFTIFLLCPIEAATEYIYFDF
ncbi:MAG: hypothetical protein K6G69_02480 [Lachnospiraceae bacterium]|nr:hypothetical protein [Lachnospiraceae bacterium]